MYQTLWVTQSEAGSDTKLTSVDNKVLTDHPIEIRVLYSSINYKDALAISGKAPVLRRFPLIPGIDAIGEITHSSDPRWSIGERVIVTGWGIGEQHHGGLAEYLSVEPEWLLPLPKDLSVEQAAVIGTAGLTAMLAVLKLEKQAITPDSGPVVVTGASGGVGSFSTWILATLGYSVTAVTGDAQASEYLIKKLGAKNLLPRSEFNQPGKKLGAERWAAGIDCVGSHTLANLLATTQRNGCIATCGMAQGIELNTSVAPFILRNVQLIGVDSVYSDNELRQVAWQRYAELLASHSLPIQYRTINLKQAIKCAEQLLSGKIQGRIIVKCTDY